MDLAAVALGGVVAKPVLEERRAEGDSSVAELSGNTI